ncbi:hypothetical protein OF829_04440 [Sphingomonas sp. LB-2]|uniref:hypothetical protein n=1 Tax=Sphingomonas caeni TaxID=2984949 RepID=UPI0022325785|nr:hypothetical protein [Sphingomonas caeni]MCW3846476.1 hypothetical protein [Sphingomonas caeni]
MILRSVVVVTPQGEKRTLFFIHGADDVFLADADSEHYPAPGSVCDLSTETRRIAGGRNPNGPFLTGDGGPGEPEGEVILKVRCRR